jgi:hypothetical protein
MTWGFNENTACMTLDALPLVLEGGISNCTSPPFVENLLEHAAPTWRVELLFYTSLWMTRLRRYRQYETSSNPGNWCHYDMFLADRLVTQTREHGVFVAPVRHQKHRRWQTSLELAPSF